MKLELNELYLVKTSVENQTIKASDSHTISALLDKVAREFERVQKLEQKKQPSGSVMEAAK
jgi:hypothetical protein